MFSPVSTWTSTCSSSLLNLQEGFFVDCLWFKSYGNDAIPGSWDDLTDDKTFFLEGPGDGLSYHGPAASVRTRVVSWKEAADKKLFVVSSEGFGDSHKDWATSRWLSPARSEHPC